MKLKDIKLKKLIEILIITAAVSIMLLGLVIWIFNIPAYLRGEKGPHAMTPENSVTVNLNKTYEIENITSIDADLGFSDIDVIVNDGDTVSFVYSGSLISNPEFKEPFLIFRESMGRLTIETTFTGNYNISNSTVVLKLSIPADKLKELKLRASSGDITVFGDAAEKLIIDTSSGEIAVNGLSGESLTADSSSGDQNFINLELKSLDVSSSSGDISLNNSTAAKAYYSTSSGEIIADEFNSEACRVETTSGNVQMDNYSGNLNFSSSSGLLDVIFGEEGDEIIADTSSGDVMMTFAENAGFNIRMETSSGDFNIDFPLTLEGDYNDDSINGRIGDGEGLVRISTSSGDITIKSK
jgi:Toastrack DUF4097